MTDFIHASLRAYHCHPHSTNTDLCLSRHQLWVVVTDETDELVQVVSFRQAPDEKALRSYLRLCDYRGPLTVDDA